MAEKKTDRAEELDRDALLELNRRLQERVSGLAALHRITLALASTRDPHELLKLVVEEAVELLDADTGVVYLLESVSQRLVPRVSVGAEISEFRPLSVETDDDLVVEASQSRYHRVSSVCEKVRKNGREVEHLRLAVPLIAEGKALGVVSLSRTGKCEISSREEELLWLLAGHAAQVLENCRLYEQVQQNYRELRLLYEVQQEIVSAVGYERVIQQIVHKLKELFDAKDCTIRLVDWTGPEPVMKVAASAGRKPAYFVDRPLAGSEIDREVMAGAVVVVRDLLADPRFENKRFAIERGLVSMMSAPLRSRDKIIGTIRIYTGERRDFTFEDQKLLAAVAAQAAVAIENARLYRQIEEKNRQLRQSYEQLRRTQEALVLKEKLAMLGEMAATVAHEIRNPLTAIRGFAQRIARKREGDERVCNYCEVIVEEVDRLDRVVKDVLDFARRFSPKLAPTDLNALLKETVELLQDELVENNILFVPSFDLSLPKINVDAKQIKQVLVNLIQNARQAMPSEGTLTISTERQGDWVVLAISDTGPGIPPENLERIWEPFFTTRTHGTGLGLALARRIIEEHGGRIEVESTVGEGTTFRIFLPVHGALRAADSQERSVEVPPKAAPA